MRIAILCISLLLSGVPSFAQAVSSSLDKAVKQLLNDSQMRYATLGFYVVDEASGKVIYNHNGHVGLAAASSQKVLTSIAAFSLFGPQFRYETQLGFTGSIANYQLNGNLVITGSGDPALGSWRYAIHREKQVIDNLVAAIQKAGIQKINGQIITRQTWPTETIPGGWIWDDIGNYYGAGASAINWRENQYDLHFSSGKTGVQTTIIGTEPVLHGIEFINEVTAGKPGSGDNAIIYLAPFATKAYVRGTIPPQQKRFTISGSLPDAAYQLQQTLQQALAVRNIVIDTARASVSTAVITKEKEQRLLSIPSPSFDSLNYWFLRKSVNLYGEAFVKTLGSAMQQTGSTKAGLEVIQKFYKDQGIDPLSIRMIDGSGLSPQNRITALGLTQAMRLVRKAAWFTSFYNALPVYNNISMKSGTIGGAKSFTGYIKSSNGNQYTFAIIINNYNGAAGSIVQKMYAVLDVLK